MLELSAFRDQGSGFGVRVLQALALRVRNRGLKGSGFG